MKKSSILVLSAAMVLFACGEKEESSKDVALNNQVDSVSYSLGLNMAVNIKRDFQEGNLDAFIKGYYDGFDSNSVKLIPEDQIQNIISPYFQKKQMEAQMKQQQEMQKQAEEQYGSVKEEGVKFLEENQKREGVVTTPSGLQYEVLKEGSGDNPTATSVVTVHYHGTTPSGEVFDSSVDRGEPATFGLNQVIAGWTEGLQYMKPGAKYKFFIPQELAYGANAPGGGQGPIKPFMPLVFEVELLEIKQ